MVFPIGLIYLFIFFFVVFKNYFTHAMKRKMHLPLGSNVDDFIQPQFAFVHESLKSHFHWILNTLDFRH